MMSNIGVLAKIQGEGYTQFGKKILATQMRFATLEAIFEVDEDVQRKLDPNKRVQIREFIINAIEAGEDFYFSPFVFSARGAIKETGDGWELEPGSKLYITDGQHRMSSLASAISNLISRKEIAEESGQVSEAHKLQSYIESLKEYPVAMQIYLSLEQKEERQLFTDINTERREAHAGQVMLYDRRDRYTEMTRELAVQIEPHFEIEKQLSRMTRHNSALTSLATMKKCILALFEGNLTVKRGSPSLPCSPEEAKDIAMEFFLIWSRIFPKQKTNRDKYTAGYTGIQLSLAYCVNRLCNQRKITYQEAINELLVLKKVCTWKHDDPMFRHLFDPSGKRIKAHSSTRNIQHTSRAFLNAIIRERGWHHDYQ